MSVKNGWSSHGYIDVSFLSLLGKDEVTFLLDCTCFFHRPAQNGKVSKITSLSFCERKGCHDDEEWNSTCLQSSSQNQTGRVNAFIISKRFGKKEVPL